ncbi:zincin-like metallopeptidase domain-containing protein [Daejeonella sp. JGW-45]|uniref:ArdC family protein n=1 Tax=Daejeonella sp. JGW-45 TaxID=3034148 RepID=UPI0023EC47CC|nr:zincin-like metallopeptidase domain-containing protein [Daejeonella sp. JGW-45]
MMAGEKAKALHIQVAEKLIEQLKAGTAPWQKPWSSENLPAFELPYNVQTGNRYKGINTLMLLLAEREDPRWMTFKQAAASDWQVKKGEKGTMIQFVKTTDQQTKRDEKGKPVLNEQGQAVKINLKLDKPIITSAWVFNAEQINGIPSLERQDTKSSTWNPLERAESLIKQSGAVIHHRAGDRAFYSPLADQITMPLREQFDEPSKYYATILHELGHWTGHTDRLDRSIMNRFGTEDYAREELRAEIASLLIGQELRIGHDPAQHAAYVDSWIKVLQETPFEIHSAAADAEKIFNYLSSIERKQEIKAEISTKFLSIGDEIPYKETVYKVQGHLKHGRLRMEDQSNGNTFILSRSDGLYGSLLHAKQELATGKTVQKTIEPLQTPEPEIAAYGIKR